jgi:hypothetical protein
MKRLNYCGVVNNMILITTLLLVIVVLVSLNGLSNKIDDITKERYDRYKEINETL